MATYVKYQNAIEYMMDAAFNFSSDAFKIALTNAAPNVATHTVRADITELGTAGGYTSGGATVTVTGHAESGGTFTFAGTAASPTWTATAAGIGPFRYVVLYDDTHASDGLIAYWDYGSSITLADTETFTVTFGANIFTAS